MKKLIGSFSPAIANKSKQFAFIFLLLTFFAMPISTAATNILMGLALITWLISGELRQQFEGLMRNPVAKAILGLFVLICIGSLYSSGSLEDIVFQLMKYAKLLFILPAMALLQEEKCRISAKKAFSMAMLLTLILSLVSVIWPLSFVKGTVNGLSDNHYVFKDHIAQNLLMSFFVLLMLVRGQIEAVPRKKFGFFAIAILAMIDILFFVQGRTGYVSLALNILVFIIFMVDGSRQKIAWLLAAFLTVYVAIHFSPILKGRIEMAVKEYENRDLNDFSSIGQRVEFTKKSIELIKERPIFGFGTGSYSKEFCRVAETQEWCEAGKFHPHNQFMAFGVQLGLVGIIAYLGVMVIIARQAMQFRLTEKTIALGILATLIVDSLTHAPLFLATEAHFFVLWIAMSSVTSKSSIRDEPGRV